MPGSRGELAVGILGVESRLEGVARCRRWIAVESSAPGHLDLQLDQVEPGGQLGDGVLDLEAGVHLHEVPAPRLGRVEELDGAGAGVPGPPAQLGRAAPDLGLLPGPEQGARGLLDHLLVVTLECAVAEADGPHAAVVVGDDLDLDVAGVQDLAFEEHRRVAERVTGFGPGRLEGAGQLRGVGHPADAAAAAPAGRLDEQRVADRLRRGGGLVEVGDGAAAPRDDGNAGRLGEPLGSDLVAEPPHGVAGRTDEDDAQLVAQVDEPGLLGDEAPARPDGVRAGRDQGLFEPSVVEVGLRVPPDALVERRCRADARRLVGLSDEPGVPVGLGVERDGRQTVAALVVELGHRVDEAHGRLTSVDDGDPLERHPAPPGRKLLPVPRWTGGGSGHGLGQRSLLLRAHASRKLDGVVAA
jgi:hypothetical protein